MLPALAALCWSLALSAAAARHAAAPPSPRTVHVSPAGRDDWSGRLREPAPDGRDGPVATLSRALAVARALRRADPENVPRIVLGGGRYELAEAVVIGPDDSGTAAAPLRIEAAPGEAPVLSGGAIVTGWTLDRATGLWGAPLPPGPGRVPRHLVVDGAWSDPARLPRGGHYPVEAPLAPPGPAGEDLPVSGFRARPGDVAASWAVHPDAELVLLRFWMDAHFPLRAVDEATGAVVLGKTTRRRFFHAFDVERPRFYVQNLPEAATRPGDWYADSRRGRIHLRLAPGDEPGRHTVVAPRLPVLLRVEGDPSAGRPVRHVELRGLVFSDTTWAYPDREAGDTQAAGLVPGAVQARGLRDAAILGGRFVNLGTYGIELGPGCADVRVAGNELAWLGAGGVRVAGGDARSPPAARTSRIAVTDNRIHHLGRTYRGGVGVLVMHGDGCDVSHNEIHDGFYSGISVGWSWGYGPSASRDNLVAFNHVHHLGADVLSDMAGIYLLGVAPGTVVRNNLVHDVDAHARGAAGIYLDEGSSEVLVERNVVHRTKYSGFHLNYGRDVVVRNNLFAFGGLSQVSRARPERFRALTFERNVVVSGGGDLLDGHWVDGGVRLERNLYWCGPGCEVRLAGASLEAWRRRGNDLESVVADPQLVEGAGGRLELAPASPARRLGFEPIDLSAVGPRPGGATSPPPRVR